MPGLLQQRRKRPPVELSDDDDDASDHSSASAGSKRARHTHDASSGHIRTNGRRHDERTTHRPPDNEFQPGTLVRVRLENFVTYTAAEFHLGPSLNMIIGPNGTGKSTLVCAICLGLGWSSEHLGRAKELNLFVKNGSEQATIEIELAAAPGMSTNPVVRRIIRRSDGKSIFYINDKVSGKNAVLALCKQFSIQIDNLCQFLPQDRVVEFAKMSDVERLRETQRAAAPRHMVEWHDQLKGLRAEEKDLETKQQNEKRHLDGLERQQNADRDDVERFHQREGLLQKSRCLEQVRPIIELTIRKNELNEAKKDLQLARRELDQINADVEPIRQAQDEAEAYKDQVENVVKLRKNRVDMIKVQTDKVYAKLDKERQAVATFDAQIEAEVKSKRDRERDINRVNAEIQRLERQRQDQPVDYDAESFDARKSEIRTQERAAQSSLVECDHTYKAVRERALALSVENKEKRLQRARLDTQDGKREAVLQNLSRDTAKAWGWFQAHKHELHLKGEVYGPAILECSIQDPRFADAVESQLRKGDLLAITCTHKDDQRMLSDHFMSQTKLNLHDVYTRTSLKPLSEYRVPVPASELPALGFSGYVIDYIQGPDALLAMLCANTRLHQIAYAAQPISDEQHAAVSSSAIQKWVSGRDIFQITTRREYGASSTAVTQLWPARSFVDQPANTEEKRRLDDDIKDFQRQGLEMQEEMKNCKQKTLDLKQQVQDLRQAREDIQAEQDRMQKAVAQWRALPDKIQLKQDDRDRLCQSNADTSNRIRTIKFNGQQALLSVAELTLDYAKTVTQLRTFHESLVEAEIRLLEAKSEFNALRTENRDVMDRLQKKQAEIQVLDDSNTRRRQEYKKLAGATQSRLNNLSAEEKAMVLEYRELSTLEALELEVHAVSARLSMMVEGNSGTIRAFEKRKEDIAKTQEKLEQHVTYLENTKAKILEIRNEWEPELDALISKISHAFAHNFEQIGCAGEVQVYKDEEDFDKWSIQISVRFREGETLSILNSHRQSGGERAVSTIFYLMALQDLAQSPFRVVDEINQGMDPRNERMVHERMVDIACQERTSQYFLVTPKLLPGLKYHPKMKVHIINSGEHVPNAAEAQGTWNMHQFAKIALRARKGIEVA
ncbi:P-loop containing nucleoside triphosphate hydrolase protein [Phaeosphaeria sp. MPI-PUGE-AT-0046c]|nr:P-loop containing nucleoside triphosphate hydrolase protein [Phaeosphaeria sp. MPI-PUGE-AT-0046c]